jgi:hypothetical protein
MRAQSSTILSRSWSYPQQGIGKLAVGHAPHLVLTDAAWKWANPFDRRSPLWTTRSIDFFMDSSSSSAIFVVPGRAYGCGTGGGTSPNHSAQITLSPGPKAARIDSCPYISTGHAPHHHNLIGIAAMRVQLDQSGFDAASGHCDVILSSCSRRSVSSAVSKAFT